jgi:hypothetical protein
MTTVYLQVGLGEAYLSRVHCLNVGVGDIARAKGGVKMLKKMLGAAVAAAALAVPLAGAAWADTGSTGGTVGTNGNGVGTGGVPGKFGEPPGSVYSGIAQTKPPGTSEPAAIGAATGGVAGPTVQPGQVTKVFTPGCGQGNSGNDISGTTGCVG